MERIARRKLPKRTKSHLWCDSARGSEAARPKTKKRPYSFMLWESARKNNKKSVVRKGKMPHRRKFYSSSPKSIRNKRL
jgi:hypothetical protein